MVRRAGIIGLGMSVPESVVTNEDLRVVYGIDTSDEWIRTRSGISERRIARKDEPLSKFAIAAAQAALGQAGIEAGVIDFIIFATVTGDYPTPATASLVQHALGANKAACFDVSAGCTGWITAMDIADSYIASGKYRHGLVIGADELSAITNWTDRGTAVLLADGAGAAVVSQVDGGLGINMSYLRSDGSNPEFLFVPAGGSKAPCTVENLADHGNKLAMNGPEIFKFAPRAIKEVVDSLLDQVEEKVDDLDFLFFHQANIRIIESAMKRLGLPMTKTHTNIDRYGNTSSASIPMVLCEAVEAGRLKQGDFVAAVGFGAGLTWGGLLMRWAY